MRARVAGDRAVVVDLRKCSDDGAGRQLVDGDAFNRGRAVLGVLRGELLGDHCDVAPVRAQRVRAEPAPGGSDC